MGSKCISQLFHRPPSQVWWIFRIWSLLLSVVRSIKIKIWQEALANLNLHSFHFSKVKLKNKWCGWTHLSATSEFFRWSVIYHQENSEVVDLVIIFSKPPRSSTKFETIIKISRWAPNALINFSIDSQVKYDENSGFKVGYCRL